MKASPFVPFVETASPPLPPPEEIEMPPLPPRAAEIWRLRENISNMPPIYENPATPHLPFVPKEPINTTVHKASEQPQPDPIEPEQLPPSLPERRVLVPSKCCGQGISRKRKREKREKRQELEEKSKKKKGKGLLDKNFKKMKDEIESKEKALREKKRILFSLKVRNKRINMNENLQSPLFNLYNENNSSKEILGDSCPACGQAVTQKFDAAVQADVYEECRYLCCLD